MYVLKTYVCACTHVARCFAMILEPSLALNSQSSSCLPSARAAGVYCVPSKHILVQGFSLFLTPQPLKTVPHAVVTLNHNYFIATS